MLKLLAHQSAGSLCLRARSERGRAHHDGGEGETTKMNVHCCMVARYSTTLAIRMATERSEESSARNVGPQTGMSSVPCSGMSGLPLVMNFRTSARGNTP